MSRKGLSLFIPNYSFLHPYPKGEWIEGHVTDLFNWRSDYSLSSRTFSTPALMLSYFCKVQSTEIGHVISVWSMLQVGYSCWNESICNIISTYVLNDICVYVYSAYCIFNFKALPPALLSPAMAVLQQPVCSLLSHRPQSWSSVWADKSPQMLCYAGYTCQFSYHRCYVCILQLTRTFSSTTQKFSFIYTTAWYFCYFSWPLGIVLFKNCVHFLFWIAKIEKKKMFYNNVLLFVFGNCLGLVYMLKAG